MTLPAVMFDMDGLLLDTEKVCLECFVATRREFGLPDNPDVFLKCVGLRGEKPERIIRESLGDKVELAAFDTAWDKKIDASISRDVPVKSGAITLVRALAAKGVLMGVATSTNTQRAKAQLDRAGLLAYFTCVIGGDLVQNHKPNPEVYHKVAQILGVKAKDCVAFEDSETGTRAAVASGAITVQVPDLIQPSQGLIALGHIIAPTLIAGALRAGLIGACDIESEPINPNAAHRPKG
mgnify:CR=1 FL=1